MASQVHRANQVTLVILASLRQFACHQPHQHANLAHQDHLDPLVSQGTKDLLDNLATKARQAKMLNQAPQDHLDHLAPQANLDPLDHPVMQANQPKAPHLAQEMPDHLVNLAHKAHQAPMETPAPMASQAAQDPKVHQVPPDLTETLAQMDSLVAKDPLVNKESLAFVPNIARWTVGYFSKTGYADKSIDDQQPPDCSSLSKYHLLALLIPKLLYFIAIFSRS